MKKLQRYVPAIKDGSAHDAQAAILVPANSGPAVMHDEHVRALNERQLAYNIVYAQNQRYERCVEIGDRMRGDFEVLIKIIEKLSPGAKVTTDARETLKLWDTSRKEAIPAFGAERALEALSQTIEDTQLCARCRQYPPAPGEKLCERCGGVLANVTSIGG